MPNKNTNSKKIPLRSIKDTNKSNLPNKNQNPEKSNEEDKKEEKVKVEETENTNNSISESDNKNIIHNSLNTNNNLININSGKSENAPNDNKDIIISKESPNLPKNENPKEHNPSPKIEEEKEKEKEKEKKDTLSFNFSSEQESTLFLGDTLNETYFTLLEDEQKLTNIPVYGYMNNQPFINEQMRAVLIDWLIDLNIRFGYKEETIYQAVWIIDAYLSKEKVSRNNLQLLGITALLISCKENEIYFPPLEQCAFLTDRAYKKEELLQFENKIMRVLEFNILVPASCNFYNILSKAYNFDKKQYLFGKYILDSCLVDYNLTKYKASVIAVACIYIVMKYFGMNNYKELYTKGIIKDNNPKKIIKDAAKDICVWVKCLHSSNLQVLKNKYSLPEYLNVAQLCEIKNNERDTSA